MSYKLGKSHSKLNRYSNILPYDHNIPCSHYVNASSIKFKNKEYNKIIAAQAPVPQAFAAFYCCIFERKIKVVVMLCNLVENCQIKADKYWPDNQKTTEIDNFTITCLETKIIRDSKIGGTSIIHRSIQICYNNESHTFEHLQYLKWPDFGVPNDLESFKNLIKMVNFYTSLDTTILVHCSAGIGRTGVFIGIHYGLYLNKNNELIDVNDIICDMRKCRAGMVQTCEQHQFIIDFFKT